MAFFYDNHRNNTRRFWIYKGISHNKRNRENNSRSGDLLMNRIKGLTVSEVPESIHLTKRTKKISFPLRKHEL